MMPRSILAALGLLASVGTALPVSAAPADEAIAVIESLHAGLVEVAVQTPPLTFDARTQTLAPLIRQTHDLSTMARLTVRRYWRRWTENDRTDFAGVFERLSIATYANRFSGIGQDIFAIVDAVENAPDQVDVNALIRRPDADDVPMRYQLRSDGESWRIINVFADGVSELSLMGSEYFTILESGDLPDLIAELESQITNLR